MFSVVDLITSDEVNTLKVLLVVFKDGAFLNLISHYNDNTHAISIRWHFQTGRTIIIFY